MPSAPRNPYIAGKALRDARGFWGRDDVFRVVQAELEQPERNAIVLFGQRRIGKTSILLNLQSRLPSPPFVAVYFDLMDRARKPLAEVLFELATTIAGDLNLTGPTRGEFMRDATGQFRKHFLPLVYTALNQGQRLVLLFDEFDVLDVRQEEQLPNQSAAQAFFPYLRELMANEPRLGFVFVVGRKAGELSIEAKAAFKAARYYRISVLDNEATRALVRSAESSGALQFEPAAIDRILALTSNHPYFTQLLCQLIFEREYAVFSSTSPATPARVTITDVESAIPKVIEAGENIFEWIWDGLPPAERVIFSAVAAGTNEQTVVSEDRLLMILQASGVRILVRELELAPKTLIEWEMLREAEGGYRFFVELMRRWVAARKPLAKVKDELDKINPLADMLYQAANGFVRRGDWSKAEEQLKQALGVNSNHLKARLLLAETYKTLNRPDDQLRELAEAYRIDEDGCRIQYETALLERAEALERDTQNNAALQLYARVLEISPNNRTAKERRKAVLTARGEAALKAGELEIARSAFADGDVTEQVHEVDRLIQQRDAEISRKQAAMEARDKERRRRFDRITSIVSVLAVIGIIATVVVRQFQALTPTSVSPTATSIVATTPTVALAETVVSLAGTATAQGIQSTPTPITQVVFITAVVPLTTLQNDATAYRVAFNPNDQSLAVGLKNDKVIGWNIVNPVAPVSTGQIDVSGSVLALAYRPDGAMIAIGCDNGDITLWHLEGKTATQHGSTLRGHRDRVNDLAFSPDGNWLASASYDGTAKLWDIRNSEFVLLTTFKGHTDRVTSVVFSPDGKTVATGSWDKTIRLWDVSAPLQTEQPSIAQAQHENWVTSLVFNSNGNILVSGGNDDTIRIWDVSTRTAIVPLGNPIKTQFDTVQSITLAPDDKVLAAGYFNGAVIFWNIANPSAPQLLGAAAQGHTGSVWQVALSPNGTLLASVGDDGLTKLWQVPVQRAVAQNKMSVSGTATPTSPAP